MTPLEELEIDAIIKDVKLTKAVVPILSHPFWVVQKSDGCWRMAVNYPNFIRRFFHLAADAQMWHLYCTPYTDIVLANVFFPYQFARTNPKHFAFTHLVTCL